jgi:Glycosyl hydrolases family 2, sugar binding domain/Beta-galactosidase second all-beta domain
MRTIINSIKYIVLFSILVLPFNVMYAEDWKELVDLSGYWKFNIGDDKEWSKYDYDDTSWEEIKVPSSWEDEGYHGYNGYAWYRKQIHIPHHIQNKSLYISLGYIDDADEVYLNGRLIGSSGSFPPKFETAYNAYRKYPVSAEYFEPGKENVIAVRVYDSRLNGGITWGNVSIMILEALDLEVNLEGFWKFKLGDDLSWKSSDYFDAEWDSIQVPAHWEIHGYQDYNGFAWYRKEFFLEESFVGDQLVLLLGKIDDIDECYLNGKIIGSTGDFDRTPRTNRFENEYVELRGYYIPENLIKYGDENVISVRVYDGFRDGGIYQGPIGITTQEEYRSYWKERKRNKGFWDFIFNN